MKVQGRRDIYEKDAGNQEERRIKLNMNLTSRSRKVKQINQEQRWEVVLKFRGHIGML